MAQPNEIDAGGEEEWQNTPQDDSLPGQPEEQRDESRAQHDAVMDELAPPEPPKVDPEELRIDHDAVLNELSESLAEPMPDAPVNEAKQAAQLTDVPIEKKPGRYYVEPKSRTPANREDRRATHDRLLKEMEERHEEADDSVPVFDDQPSQDAKPMQDFANATANGMERLAIGLMDATRRIDEIMRRLENDRL